MPSANIILLTFQLLLTVPLQLSPAFGLPQDRPIFEDEATPRTTTYCPWVNYTDMEFKQD